MFKLIENLSIRNKIFFVSSITIIILFYLVSNTITNFLTKDFLRLEKQLAEKNITRATNAFQDKIDSLSNRIIDWAQWDETYGFVRGVNNNFVERNLNSEVFKGLGVNFIVITDESKNIIYKQLYDHTGAEKPFPADLENYFNPKNLFIDFDNLDKNNHSGVVVISEGIIIMASTQITPTNGIGKPIGSITFGYYFDERSLKPLSELAQLDLSYVLFQDKKMSPGFEEAKKYLTKNNPIYIENTNDPKSISGYALINSINNQPALILKIKIDRPIYQSGQRSIAFLNILSFVIGIFFLIVVLLLFEFLVIRRLLQIKNEVETIGRIDSLNTRLTTSGTDEFSQLSREINRMLDKIKINEMKKNELEKSKTILDKALVKQNKELNQRLNELKKLNEAMVDRELTMVELKNKISQLEKQLKK